MSVAFDDKVVYSCRGSAEVTYSQKHKLYSINMEAYFKIEKIGEGTYGVVYKAMNKLTGQLVAMKKVRLDTCEGIPSTSIREISLLKVLKHPNIVKLDDVLFEQAYLYLVFEFLTMDLRRYMDLLGPAKVSEQIDVVEVDVRDHNYIYISQFMDPRLVKSYMYQINSAMLYCHQRCVMHRDLKPQNLLVSEHGVIKVADFGLGRACKMQLKVYTQEVVTLWYRAPEVLLGSNRYSLSIDIWAMGCIFAEMLCKKPLFRGDSEIDQLFCIFRLLGTPTEDTWPNVAGLPAYKCTLPSWETVELKKLLTHLDEKAVDLLTKMLTYNPKKRIIAKAIEKHSYFRDVTVPRKLNLNLPRIQ